MKTSKNITLAIIILIVLAGISYVFALPSAPTITYLGNSTKTTASGLKVNTTGNDTSAPDKAGGFIFTIRLNADSQTDRWKGYVGNVSGSLVLDDTDGYTIYDWAMTTSISGEVYATRTSGAITWDDVNCSTSTNITNEEIAMNHTENPNDNISTTFNDTDNSEFYIGSTIIGANTCYTTNIFVNDSSPINDNFEEVLLHDGSNMIYTSIIEENQDGYNNRAAGDRTYTYDFQMILPERGYSGWSQSTPYYFFVELD